MNHAVTWESLIWGVILFLVALWCVSVVLRSVAALILYRIENKSEDDAPTSDPYAGKTLGL